MQNRYIAIPLIIICFVLSSINSIAQEMNVTNEEVVSQADSFFIPDETAMFSGCDSIELYREKKQCAEKKMLEFIYKRINYPESAKLNKEEGMVISSFYIEKNGEVSSIEIIESVTLDMDLEVIRVLSSMPNWIPAKHEGEFVREKKTLPISFKYYENDKKQQTPPEHRNVTFHDGTHTSVRTNRGRFYMYNGRVSISNGENQLFSNYNGTTHTVQEGPDKSGIIVKRKEINSITSKHKRIAVLPANVIITDHTRTKKKHAEKNKTKEIELQKEFQEALFNRIVKMQVKEKLTVEVQIGLETTKRLKEIGIEDIRDLEKYQPHEIAAMLDVDAFFWPHVTIDKYLGKAETMALKLMADVSINEDETSVNLLLFDKNGNNIIWEYNRHFLGSGLINGPEISVERIFKEGLARKFPYHFNHK